ncbi:MAG: class I SAM-dependent methyltransferase [Bacteroidales bacterium]|nr:class I SAM-dependent methyltransferase [Bacteroidales bacterium]
MNEFDIKAEAWDNNPMHVERAQSVSGAIREQIPLTRQMRALEFGAGTGITSFFLKDDLGEITLMDSSREMLRVADEKIRASGSGNLKTLFHDMSGRQFTENRFDLIFSQMVLHHIIDVEDIISKFHSLLNPGGYLAIADLYPEDGSFHEEGFDGHKGFDPEELSGLLKRAGFENTNYRKCYTINKKTSELAVKPFDLFLLVASRQQNQHS